MYKNSPDLRTSGLRDGVVMSQFATVSCFLAGRAGESAGDSDVMSQ